MDKIKSTSDDNLFLLATTLIKNNQGQEMLNILADLLLTENATKTLYSLYLGLDVELNDTTRHEIAEIVADFTDSFTITKANGYFRKQPEFTQLVQIAAENNKVAYDCAEKLRSQFNQIAVGVVEMGQYRRVTNDIGIPPY